MTASPPGTRPLAWAVLAAAVLEVVAPAVTILGPGSSPGSGVGADLLITPVGWAFAIWGVIYTLAIVQAIAVLLVGPEEVSRRVQLGQVVLYLGGSVWIVMSAIGSSLLTAVALLVMFVAALDLVLAVARLRDGRVWLRRLTRAASGLYGGWVTAAFFLNLGTAVVALDLAEAGRVGWQLGLVVVAALVLLVLTLATRIVAYTAAGLWALLGIAVTGAANDDTSVLAFAIVAGVVLLAASLAAPRLARPVAG